MSKVEIPWVSELPETGSPNNLGTNLVYKYTEPRGLFECYADGAWQAVGGTQIATRTLTNAQIKALPTTPFTIAEGVPNKILVPVGHSFVFNTLGDEYTNVDQYPQLLCNGHSYIDDWVQPDLFGNKFFAGFIPSTASVDVNDVVGYPLVISAPLNTGNYTGGDQNNYLKISLLYCLQDV